MNIKVNEDNISKQINGINEEIDKYKKNLNDIKIILDDISEIWEGSAHDNFDNKMTGFLGELKELFESLTTYKDFLNNYISAYNTLSNIYNNKNISLE